MSQGRYKPKRAQVLAAILAGMSPKEAAMTHGAARSFGNKVCGWARLTALYVSADERARVLTERARLTPKQTVTPAPLRIVTRHV